MSWNRSRLSRTPTLPSASSVSDVYGMVFQAARIASDVGAQEHKSYAECVNSVLQRITNVPPAQQAAVDMLLTHNADIVCMLTTHDPVFVSAQQAMSLFMASGAPNFAAFLDFFLSICPPTNDAPIAGFVSRVRGVKCAFCYCIMHQFRTLTAFAVFTSLRALWRRLSGAPATGPFTTFIPPQAAAASHVSSQSSVTLLLSDVTDKVPHSLESAMEKLSIWRDESEESERWKGVGVAESESESASTLLLAVHFVIDSNVTCTLMECVASRDNDFV